MSDSPWVKWSDLNQFTNRSSIYRQIMQNLSSYIELFYGKGHGIWRWIFRLMWVVGRRVSWKEEARPTALDFSTNCGGNSVPLLPLSLMYCRTLFRVSLVISTFCKMSFWWKFPKLYYSWLSPCIVTSKLYLLQQPHIQICQDQYPLTTSNPIYSNIITSKLD